MTEYARWLHVGLGRAVTALQQADATPYREAILQACCFSQTYDLQADGNREGYLSDVIQASGQAGWFRDRLLVRLGDEIAGQDTHLVALLVGHFAASGDGVARAALYQGLAGTAVRDPMDFAEAIVSLDGLTGLLRVASAWPETGADDDYPATLVAIVAETVDRAAVYRALAEASSDPRVVRFTALAEKHDWRSDSADDGAMEEVPDDYAAAAGHLAAGDWRGRRQFQAWGRQAAPEALRQAAEALRHESDAVRLQEHLRLFGFSRRDFPLEPDILIALAGHESSRVQHAAIGAAARLSHAAVRAYAEALLGQGRGDGARLLAANYREGDYAVLTRAALTWRDPDELHDLGFGLIDLVDAHPTPAAVPALLAHYEYGPCGQCRSSIVERLLGLGAAPMWLRAEMRWDSYAETRLLAEAASPNR